jgi:hypothetical protein
MIFPPLRLILHDEPGMFPLEIDGRRAMRLSELASELKTLWPNSYVRIYRAPDYEKCLGEFHTQDAGEVDLDEVMGRHQSRVVNS